MVQALIFLVTPKQNEVRFGVTGGLVVPELAEGDSVPSDKFLEENGSSIW